MDICRKIQEVFNRENLHVANIMEVLADEPTGIVSVGIRKGDWKHEHARAKHLLKEEFGATWFVTVTEDGEDSLDDTYSAVHYFYIPKNRR